MDSIDHISQAHLDKLLLRISANPDFQNEIEVLKGEYSLEERIETIISNSKLVPILQDCVEFFDENEKEVKTPFLLRQVEKWWRREVLKRASQEHKFCNKLLEKLDVVEEPTPEVVEEKKVAKVKKKSKEPFVIETPEAKECSTEKKIVKVDGVELEVTDVILS